MTNLLRELNTCTRLMNENSDFAKALLLGKIDNDGILMIKR